MNSFNKLNLQTSSYSDSDSSCYSGALNEVEETECQIYSSIGNNLFDTNEENVLDDAVYIYDYLNKVIGIEQKNLIIFGRSIGSGPATHLASVRNPACMLLMSAFKSIRAVA